MRNIFFIFIFVFFFLSDVLFVSLSVRFLRPSQSLECCWFVFIADSAATATAIAATAAVVSLHSSCMHIVRFHAISYSVLFACFMYWSKNEFLFAFFFLSLWFWLLLLAMAFEKWQWQWQHDVILTFLCSLSLSFLAYQIGSNRSHTNGTSNDAMKLLYGYWSNEIQLVYAQLKLERIQRNREWKLWRMRKRKWSRKKNTTKIVENQFATHTHTHNSRSVSFLLIKMSFNGISVSIFCCSFLAFLLSLSPSLSLAQLHFPGNMLKENFIWK